MNVIDVAFQIRIIANDMLPIPALPNSLLPFEDLARASKGSPGQRFDKAAFDYAPAHGEVRVAFRQSPDGMQMIWKNADGNSFKWMPFLN